MCYWAPAEFKIDLSSLVLNKHYKKGGGGYFLTFYPAYHTKKSFVSLRPQETSSGKGNCFLIALGGLRRRGEIGFNNHLCPLSTKTEQKLWHLSPHLQGDVGKWGWWSEKIPAASNRNLFLWAQHQVQVNPAASVKYHRDLLIPSPLGFLWAEHGVLVYRIQVNIIRSRSWPLSAKSGQGDQHVPSWDIWTSDCSRAHLTLVKNLDF